MSMTKINCRLDMGSYDYRIIMLVETNAVEVDQRMHVKCVLLFEG